MGLCALALTYSRAEELLVVMVMPLICVPVGIGPIIAITLCGTPPSVIIRIVIAIPAPVAMTISIIIPVMTTPVTMVILVGMGSSSKRGGQKQARQWQDSCKQSLE